MFWSLLNYCQLKPSYLPKIWYPFLLSTVTLVKSHRTLEESLGEWLIVQMFNIIWGSFLKENWPSPHSKDSGFVNSLNSGESIEGMWLHFNDSGSLDLELFCLNSYGSSKNLAGFLPILFLGTSWLTSQCHNSAWVRLFWLLLRLCCPLR